MLSSKKILRRDLLKKSTGLLAVTLLATKALAQSVQCPEPVKLKIKVVISDISNNHGHEFTVELNELFMQNGQSLSIQGRSGHPHQITLTSDQLVSLAKGEIVEVTSSKDAGHSHNVMLQVIEQELPTNP
jgi:hypothetical protein